MNGFLLALLTMVGFGLAPVLSKRLIARIGYAWTAVIIHAFAATIFIFKGGEIPSNLSLLGILVLLGGVTVFLFYYALKVADASVVVSLTYTHPILVALVEPLILGTAFSFNLLFLVLLIVAGSFLVVKRNGAKNWKRGLIPAFLVALSWVIHSLGSKVLVEEFGPWNVAYAVEIGVTTALLIGVLAKREKLSVKNLPYTDILVAGIVFTASMLLFYYSLEQNSATVHTAVLGASPVVSAIAARYLVKERLHYWQYIGIGIIVLGLILLGVLQ